MLLQVSIPIFGVKPQPGLWLPRRTGHTSLLYSDHCRLRRGLEQKFKSNKYDTLIDNLVYLHLVVNIETDQELVLQRPSR